MSGRRRDGRRDFVRDVLARTSGSACVRACGLLPDLTDGGLETLDRQLVRRHLEHCPACRAVAVTLGWLGPELAARAELDPGPDFTAAVLARTSGRTATAQARRAADLAGAGPGGLMDRLGRWWQERVLRPGFAVQTAYAATVLLVLLTGLPMSPLRQAPQRALAVIQAGPEALPLAGDASRWLTARADLATARLRGELDRRVEGSGASLADRADRTAPARDAFGRHLGTAYGHLRGGRPGDAGRELLGALHAGRDTWQLWWATHPDTDARYERSEP
ncbi:MAG: zf-HC2 domain-containing protein [Candidatus Krumholzibacteriia bacterium]